MADVQLEHGYLKIANALFEALVFVDFKGAAHYKITLCLIRLTYGWRQSAVRISNGDLAERCNLAFSGGFRRALHELIAEGVILEVERSNGRSPAVYGINKDFERWGRFSVPQHALIRLHEQRPAHVRGVDLGALNGAVSDASPYADDDPTQPPPGHSDDPTGAQSLPGEGIVSIANPPSGNGLAERKDLTTESHITSTAREGLNSIKLVVAANRGLAEHPKRPQPIPRILPGQGSTVEAVEQLEAADVPQAFAEGAIYELAKAHRSTTEVRGLLYFVAATVRQWEEAKVAEAVKSSPAPAAIARAGERKGPTWDQRNASRDVERAREERRATLDRRYAAERKEAIARWKATNAEQYAVVEAEVKADTGLFVTGGPSGQAMLDRMIEIALVDRFQCFPSADEWLEQQRVSA